MLMGVLKLGEELMGEACKRRELSGIGRPRRVQEVHQELGAQPGAGIDAKWWEEHLALGMVLCKG